MGRSSGLAGLVAAALLAASGPAVAAESDLAAYMRLRGEAQAAVTGGDAAKGACLYEQAARLYPASPGVLLRWAEAKARAGDPAGAVALLKRYADMGLTFDLARLPDLAALETRPDFAPVAARMAANARPVGEPAWTAKIDGPGPIEGLALDPATNRLFVSSIGARGVMVRARDGAVVPFTRPDERLGGLFGLAFDGGANVLWAGEASGGDVPGGGGGALASALVKIDGSSGRVIARYPAPQAPGPAQLGDVTLGADGTVYASDARGGAIYRLKPGGTTLEVFVRSDEFASPQGMVLPPGRGVMIVVDYPGRLFRIRLSDGRVEALGAPPDAGLAGIDGLILAGRDLIATQNGTTPQRVLRLTPSAGFRRITQVEVLAANLEFADDLTLMTAHGDELIFVGRSGWEAVDGEKPSPGPAYVVGLRLR